MFIGTLSGSYDVVTFSPRVQAGIDWIRNTDFSQVEDGVHEIDGRDLFAIVQSYTTKPESEAFWEAHRKYVDVQHVISVGQPADIDHCVDFVRAAEHPVIGSDRSTVNERSGDECLDLCAGKCRVATGQRDQNVEAKVQQAAHDRPQTVRQLYAAILLFQQPLRPVCRTTRRSGMIQ